MFIDTVEFIQNTADGYGGGIVAESCFLSVILSKFHKN
jgi:predicted outer membrane repeat protein